MSSQPNQPNKQVNKMLDSETWDAMKAAGFSEQELLKDQPFGPVIFSYTRKQAIEDGVLVDLTTSPLKPMLQMLGFKVHTAITRTAFGQVVGDPDLEAAGGSTDALRKLWNLLSILREAARKGRDTDRVFFKVMVEGKLVDLWCQCGPGDEGEPVLTIMLEGED